MKCRVCDNKALKEIADLGFQPLSNDLYSAHRMKEPKTFVPMNVYLCEECKLIQIEDHGFDPFNETYPFRSGISQTWRNHTKEYAEKMVRELNLNKDSLVIEVGCNDGILLDHFHGLGVPCVGIDPSGPARLAKNKGHEVIHDFFSTELAQKFNRKADLIVCNNVIAHVPDPKDFMRAVAMLIKDDGVATLEFQDTSRLIRDCKFDTIYYEHYSYFTLTSFMKLAGEFLSTYDCETISTHGGSLRVYLDKGRREQNIDSVINTIQREEDLLAECYINDFQERIDSLKNKFLNFLIHQKHLGKKVVGFGASAKATVLLNYCGVRRDLIEYIVDETPEKLGKYVPGSGIPIINNIFNTDDLPDFVIIFPWNVKDEIEKKLSYLKEHGTQFVTVNRDLKIW